MARRKADRMIRRMGEPVRQDIRYTLRPGAYAILVRDGRVLLTHQADPNPEYQLPGGGIDPGEQILPALHREVMEETGWRAAGYRRLGAFRRFTFMQDYDLWAEKMCHIYMARPAYCIGTPTEAGHSAVWATPEQAIHWVENDGDAMFLRDWLL